MSIIQAMILGAVQGITEFFPVSSSGNLALVSNMMGIGSEASLLFVIMLHMGTLLAVTVVFLPDIIRLVAEWIHILRDVCYNLRLWLSKGASHQPPSYRKLVSGNYRKFSLMLMLTMIPTVIIGYLICPLAEAVTGNLLASGMGLLVTALLLLVSSFMPGSGKDPRKARYTDALLIGAFQGFSGFPGISRLGMTISSSYLSGFSRKFVIKYSFVLCVPAILGAIILEGSRVRRQAGSFSITLAPCLAGMATAAVVGFFVIRLAIRLISKRGNRIFAAYCMIIGIISAVEYLR